MALKGTKFYGVEPELDGVRDLGLYVHVPFCKYLCPYCPYTREVYKKEKAERYTEDVKKEIDICQRLMGREKNITSFYFGGGTPSTNVGELIKIIEHARERFEIDGDVAIEANPDDLNEENLGKMWDNGIKKLSIGIQSFDDSTLKRIGRFSHDGKTAEESIVLARDVGFRDLNVDLMFNLPGQSLGELEQDLKKAIEMGAGQITTYPLILFPYTEMGEDAKDKRIKIDKANEKRMYGAALEFFKSSHYKQINVWSFSERGIDRYGSVERDDYLYRHRSRSNLHVAFADLFEHIFRGGIFKEPRKWSAPRCLWLKL
jgi:oxygen-independent coproporphyrinogen-3 oxidase